jgi:hypothetical protein
VFENATSLSDGGDDELICEGGANTGNDGGVGPLELDGASSVGGGSMGGGDQSNISIDIEAEDDLFVPQPSFPTVGKGGARATRRASFANFVANTPTRVTHPRSINPPACDWLSAPNSSRRGGSSSDVPTWSIDSFMAWWDDAVVEGAPAVSVRAGLLRLLLDEVRLCLSAACVAVFLFLFSFVARPMSRVHVHALWV